MAYPLPFETDIQGNPIRRSYVQAPMPTLREAMGTVDNFTSGIRQGFNSQQAAFDAGVAGLARSAGFNDTARDWEQSADEQAREAAQYANPAVQNTPWSENGGGWGDAAPWLVNQAGQLIGGAAPLIGGLAAGAVAAPFVPEAAGGAALASGLGMGLASYPQAVGANYQAVREANAAQGLGDPTQEQAQSAAAWGVPGAALNAVAPTRAFGVGQTASQMASRTMLEAAKDVAKVGVDNALATGGQKAIEHTFRPDISDEDKRKDMFDSIVTGFIGGAGMGAVGEGAGRIIKNIRPDTPTQYLDAVTKSILEPEKAAQDAVQERGPESILPREPAEAGEPMGGGDAFRQEAAAARPQDVEGSVSFLDEGQAPAPQEVTPVQRFLADETGSFKIGGEEGGKPDLQELLRQSRERSAASTKLVEDALASGKPKLVLENGEKKLVLSPGLEGKPYRMTSFDEKGPIGHRDYGENDLRWMADEVSSALSSGFKVRPQKPDVPRQYLVEAERAARDGTLDQRMAAAEQGGDTLRSQAFWFVKSLLADESGALKVSEKEKPVEKPTGFRTDNPGGRWLQEKQEDAYLGKNKTAEKGLRGTPTAFAGTGEEPLMLPVSELAKVGGVYDEVRKPGDLQYDELMKSVKENGYTNESPVMVFVNHKGEPYINEGNTRIAVAKDTGVDKIKAWVHWYNGAENAPGKWTPSAVAAMERGQPKAPVITREVGGGVAHFAETPNGIERIPTPADIKQPVDFPAGTPPIEGPKGVAPAVPPAPPPKSIAPVPMDALSATPAETPKPVKSWSLKAAKNSAAKFWADDTGSLRLPFQREDGAPLRTPDEINNALRDTITKMDDAKSGFGEQMRKLGLYVTTRRHQDEMYGHLMPSQLVYSKGVDHRSAISARMQALAMAKQAFANNFRNTDRDAFQRSMNVERAYQLGMDASQPWEQQPDRIRKGDNARYKEIHRAAASDLAHLRGNGKTGLLDAIREQYETNWASKPAALLYMLLKDEELPTHLRERLIDPSEALINNPDEALTPSMSNRHFATSLDEMMAIAKEYLDGQEKVESQVIKEKGKRQIAAEMRGSIVPDVIDPLTIDQTPKAPESILRTFVKEIEAQKGKLKEVPYSHLMRHGKYGLGFRIALDADGNVRSDAVENIRKSVSDAGFRNIVIEPMGDQNYVFIRSDSQSQINNLKKALIAHEAAGEILKDDFKVGTMDVFDKSPAASKVVGDLIKKIKSSDRYKAPEGASDELKSGLAKRQAQMVAALQDMMVDLLPETSAAKSAVHRDYIPGFEADPLQALAKSDIETAQHVSNLLGTARVHDALTQMRSEWEAAKDPLNPNNSYEPLMAALYRNNVMREEGRGVDNAARSWVDTFQGLNYSYFLGFNPSFALIQTMQVPMYVIPELAKRAGYMKSTYAVAKVTKDAVNVMRAVWNEARKAGGTALADMPITTEALMNAGLKEDTARFMVHMVNSGGIDTGGLSRSLSGISERRVGGFWDAYTRWAAFMGYYAETFTRVQSALAAKEVFKGDINTPEGWNKLVDYSHKIINQGLFDYANENKARAFNGTEKSLLGNATKLSTAFQSYWFMALEKMYREMHAMMVGAHLAKKRPGITDAQAKIEAKEAAKFLLGHAAATSVVAGSLALPGVNMLAGLYDKLADIADPEDGPHDIREGWSSWLEKVFGPKVGDAIAHGAPRLIGQDVSSRTTEADFIPFSSFVADRDTMRNKVKKQASKLWGAPEGALENIAGGIDKFNAGDYKGAAIDLLLPAAGLRNVANAVKESTSGRFTDSRGHTVPNVEVTPSTVASRVVGFKPTALARHQEENQMLRRYDMGIELEARNIVAPMVEALRNNDRVTFNRMLPKAREFERMHPGHKIVDRANETFKREYKELNTAEKTGMPYQRWTDDTKRKKRAQRYVTGLKE